MEKTRNYLLIISIISISFLGCKKDKNEKQIVLSTDFANFTPYTPNTTQISNIYYVDGSNPNANDSNTGTETSPWATIGHAAENITPGSKVIVKAGTYNEKTTLNIDGEADAPIIFEASGNVVTYNFLLQGNYFSLYGFTLHKAPDYDDWRNAGIFIQADNVHVDNNTVSGYTSESGIKGAWGDNFSRNVHISNNYIYQCNGGIGINGNKWYVVNNEIERLYRDADGGDADNMRYFGDSIVIKNNFMHGTLEQEIGESHVDLFQTFDNNGEEVYNVLIEGNMGTGFYHQGIMASSVVSKYNHQNLWVVKNVFANARAWGLCIYNNLNVHVYNNTFFNVRYHGVGFNEESTGIIKNNIFVNTPSGYFKDETSSYESGYNLLYHETRTYEGYKFAPTDLLNIDPMFVDPENILGNDGIPFTNDDGLKLKAGSHAIKAGEDGGNIGAY